MTTDPDLGAVRVRVRLPAAVARAAGWLTGSKTRLRVSAAIVIVGAVFLAGTGYGYEPYDAALARARAAEPVVAGERGETPSASRLRARQRQIRARLAQAAPRGRYIVVDQTNNRLFLRDSDEVLLDAVCSAGSGFVLKESGGGEREWVFDTPRGKFQVLTRIRNPIWRKPDWAFVEEGKPIPTRVEDRLEPGTLGEYGLYFGNGFLIHGTLYERLLGRSVTHGCIRLGRNDLRALWDKAPIGTPIYIF